MKLNMEAVERACFICGYHSYKEVWDAAVLSNGTIFLIFQGSRTFEGTKISVDYIFTVCTQPQDKVRTKTSVYMIGEFFPEAKLD